MEEAVKPSQGKSRVTFVVMRRDARPNMPYVRVLGSLTYAEAMNLVDQLQAKSDTDAVYWMQRERDTA